MMAFSVNPFRSGRIILFEENNYDSPEITFSVTSETFNQAREQKKKPTSE